jgi:hypothetical protein
VSVVLVLAIYLSELYLVFKIRGWLLGTEKRSLAFEKALA